MLMKRRRERLMRDEFGPALIIATFLNAFGKPKRRILPKDFMPSYEESKDSEPPWQDLLAKVNVIHAQFGGV